MLPPSASDIYYRDMIGNVSTSTVSYGDTEATLDLIMRFPLYGGWKNNFYMGYNVPTSGVLATDGKVRLLASY